MPRQFWGQDGGRKHLDKKTIPRTPFLIRMDSPMDYGASKSCDNMTVFPTLSSLAAIPFLMGRTP